MKTTTHTPGPWAASRRNNGIIPVHFQPPCVLARDGNMMLADGLGEGPEAEANARLIAAAPELLAALKGVLALGKFTHSAEADKAAARAAAVIAKANGGGL